MGSGSLPSPTRPTATCYPDLITPLRALLACIPTSQPLSDNLVMVCWVLSHFIGARGVWGSERQARQLSQNHKHIMRTLLDDNFHWLNSFVQWEELSHRGLPCFLIKTLMIFLSTTSCVKKNKYFVIHILVGNNVRKLKMKVMV